MREDGHILHHRETDPTGSDFRQTRHLEEREVIIKKNGSLGRILLGIAGGIIMLLLSATAFMVGRDRNKIDDDFELLRNRANVNMNAIGRLDTQMAAVHANQESMTRDVGDLKRISEENQVMLRTLLAESRRK